ncbi:hypothetical protein ABIA38_009084 [Embleya sp. AB8]
MTGRPPLIESSEGAGRGPDDGDAQNGFGDLVADDHVGDGGVTTGSRSRGARERTRARTDHERVRPCPARRHAADPGPAGSARPRRPGRRPRCGSRREGSAIGIPQPGEAARAHTIQGRTILGTLLRRQRPLQHDLRLQPIEGSVRELLLELDTLLRGEPLTNLRDRHRPTALRHETSPIRRSFPTLPAPRTPRPALRPNPGIRTHRTAKGRRHPRRGRAQAQRTHHDRTFRPSRNRPHAAGSSTRGHAIPRSEAGPGAMRIRRRRSGGRMPPAGRPAHDGLRARRADRGRPPAVPGTTRPP